MQFRSIVGSVTCICTVLANYGIAAEKKTPIQLDIIYNYNDWICTNIYLEKYENSDNLTESV